MTKYYRTSTRLYSVQADGAVNEYTIDGKWTRIDSLPPLACEFTPTPDPYHSRKYSRKARRNQEAK
jgi:hypothetical protein